MMSAASTTTLPRPLGAPLMTRRKRLLVGVVSLVASIALLAVGFAIWRTSGPAFLGPTGWTSLLIGGALLLLVALAAIAIGYGMWVDRHREERFPPRR